MHPVVYSEIHQTKRNLPAQLFLLLCFSALIQLALGLPGVLAVLSPTMLAAIGVSTFAEEYSKGQMRFLYSMPISAAAIWRIKVFSGIVGSCLVIAVILSPALFIRGPLIELPLVVERGFSSSGLLVVLAGQAVLAFAAGLFSIGFCQAGVTAVLFASLISFVTFLGCALIPGVLWFLVPSAPDLGLALAVASVPLWLGGYVLFRCRNPFVDQPWRWRGVAAVVVGVEALVVTAAGYALTFHPLELTNPYRDGVYNFRVFARGSKVLALARRGLWDVTAYTLASDGRLAREIFRSDRPLLWTLSSEEGRTESPLVFCYRKDFSIIRWNAAGSWLLLNVETGEHKPINRLEGHGKTAHDYRMFSRDGGSALGFKLVQQEGKFSQFAFRQDLRTSDVRETLLCESAEGASCVYYDESRVLLAEWASENAAWKLTLIDLDSGARTPQRLPGGVRYLQLAPDGRTCIALLRLVTTGTIGQEVAVMDVEAGRWRTVLTSQELPRVAVKDAIDKPLAFADARYPDPSSPDWLVCSIYNPDGSKTGWLISGRTGKRFSLPQSTQHSLPDIKQFSKDGGQFFACSSMAGDEETGRSSSRQLVRVYRVKNSGIELVNSFTCDVGHLDLAWLGDDRLLYCKHLRSELFPDRGELWTWEIATGEERPFFQDK